VPPRACARAAAFDLTIRAEYDAVMLLRLRVKGFKNLRDVDIRFGPLTCFVGPNGVGKSNIFDAIQFLRYLADDEFQRAGERVRGPASGSYSPLELFWRNDPQGRIEFEADMLLPLQAIDDFGQAVEPTISIVKYAVHFGFEQEPRPRLVLLREELTNFTKGEAKERIGFPHSRLFRDSMVQGRRSGTAFISTAEENGVVVVSLHGDAGSRGRPVPAAPSPRTVLAGTSAAEYPTVIAARREMSGWHALHLEPSSLRTPDRFGDPASVDEHGRHIAATLARLTRVSDSNGSILQECTNRLTALVPEIQQLRIDKDELREQLVVQARMKGSDLWMSPRSLSDGTLRFLALVTMQLDAGSSRLLCMEEPENGIHPNRIAALIEVLRDYVMDAEQAISADNPARQMILNTHSSEVLRQLDIPEVLFVDTVHTPEGREAAVRPIRAEGNWRGSEGAVELHIFEKLIGARPLSPALKARQLDLDYGTSG
jgi:predicted ATPase